jgi:hypothetical protein
MKIWNTLRSNLKVSNFLGWQRDGTLILNPNFQRRPVWKTGAKSYLIDTILRGLPIPIIFLRELATDLKTFRPKTEVVDGQQRLRTLLSFIMPDSLPDFQAERDDFRIKATHNKEYGDKSFRELPADAQQQILDYQFSVHTFPSDTDDREILQIFARMNSTGVKANAQELRNAEFFGEFKTVAFELAAEQLNRWRNWHIFTPDDIARMEEVELTSEFMLMMLKGLSPSSEKVITAPYKEFDDRFPDSEEIQKRFRQVFDTVNAELSSEVASLFSKRTLFYALFVAVYDLQYEDPHGKRSLAKSIRPKGLPEKTINWIRKAGKHLAGRTAPEEVMAATTRRTTHIKERRTLVEYIKGK